MEVTLRLSDEDTEALRAAAERDGLSLDEAVRLAVRTYLDDWRRERASFLADFADENASLLDRLGQ